MPAAQYNARVFQVLTPSGADALDSAGRPIAYIAPPDYVYSSGSLPAENYMILRGWVRATDEQLALVSSDCTPIVPSTQPVFNSPTPDWNITTPGSQPKYLAENEFILVDGVPYTFQAFMVNGDTLTSLPGYLSFDGPNRTFTASIPAGMNPVSITIRVVVSDPSGSSAQDEFNLTVNVPPLPEELNSYSDDGDWELSSVSPRGVFRIIDAAQTLTVSEAGSLQLILQEQYTDGSWVTTTRARTWRILTDQPEAFSITTGGLLSVAANSLSANKDITVQAIFDNSQVADTVTVHVNNLPEN